MQKISQTMKNPSVSGNELWETIDAIIELGFAPNIQAWTDMTDERKALLVAGKQAQAMIQYALTYYDKINSSPTTGDEEEMKAMREMMED